MVSLDIKEVSGRIPYWVNGQLQSVTVNPLYGKGCLSSVISLPSGIMILIQDFSLYGNGNIQLWSDSEEKIPLIAFSNILSGVCQLSRRASRVPLSDGISDVEFPGYNSSIGAKIKANTPVKIFSVCMEPAVFENLTRKSSSVLLEMLDSSAQKKSVFNRSRQIDLAQKICGHQAFDSFVSWPHDTLFLEAKALELMALQLRQLEYLTGNLSPQEPVKRHREKIHCACEILQKEMADPPDKLSLARRAGLNHNQLVEGFKELVGLCPFEYLRILRLEKTRDLIASQQCNVTEAAFAVGYSSLSHFSKNFRKEFGITPKALQKDRERSDF